MSGIRVPLEGKGQHEDNLCYVRDTASWCRVREAVFRGEYVAILGAKFCGKTSLLQDVLGSLRAEEIYYCTYFDFNSSHIVQIPSLFQQLAVALHSAVLESGKFDLPLKVDKVCNGQDFRYLLASLLVSSSRPVLVALDHIEALPRYLAKELLRCLRVVYNERSVHREYGKLIVLTSGVLNLFVLTASKISPFNIAHPVPLTDMSNEQSRILVSRIAKCLGADFSVNAVNRIIEATEGDRYLIHRLCQMSVVGQREGRTGRVSLPAVNRAIDELVAHEPCTDPCIGEMIRAVEAKPFILETVLDVLRGQKVKRRELLTEIGELELTGALKVVDHLYTIRNEIYARFLRRHFSARRVARVFSTAGRWSEAVRHFEQANLLGEASERADYLAAIVSCIYAETDDRQAFRHVGRALERAFGVSCVIACSHDERSRRLVPVVCGAQDSFGQIEPIHLYEKSNRIEARAFYGGDYLLEEDEDGNVFLAFPLRSPGGLTVGTVTLYNHFPIDRFIEHREEVLEMASFLSQAAQAIATIREKQALLQREQQRAQELAALNEVALIITAALDTKELLGKIVESAAKVVGADYVSVVLVGKDGTLDTSVDDFQGVPPLHLRARNQGKTREVIKTGKPIIVDSVSADDPSKHNPAIVRAGVESYAGIPIMSRGQVLGVLFVHSHRVGAFQGRISLLTTFVNQAAVALENARLFEEIQRWLRELKSLFEVGKNISTILDPDQLLRIIVEAAVQAIPAADKSSVHLLDEGEKRLSIRASVGYSPEVAKVVQLRVGDGLAGLVMQTGQSLIIQDFQTDSRVAWHDAHPEIAEIRSSVCVPLATQKRTIGALSVDNVHQVGAFSAEDARLLSALANQAAIAIENAQLYKRQAEDMATLAQLYQISTTLRTSLNPDHVLKIITANLQRMFDLATCTIGLLDEAEEQLDFVAHRGLEGPTTRSVRDLPQDLWRKVRVEKRRIFLEDLSKYPELAKQLERQDLKSFAVLPLQARERFLGILTMGSTERLVLDRFNWDLILALTDQAAVAIENAQLYQEVHQARKALDDSLKILTHQLRAEPAFVTNMVATLLAGKLGDLNKKQRDRLQKARRRLDEHHRLIDNINMYGRLKGGKIVPRRETIELAQLVRGAVASRRSEARRRGLVLRARLRKLPSIEADEGMIEIVLGNLLDNAVKFTPRGGHVCVEAWSDTEGVHIVIDDTGPGIRIEEREKVFDEYHQLESTPIRAEKGAGLGLYIAKKFVRMHEGRIAIVDKEGPGTRVEVVIPR